MSFDITDAKDIILMHEERLNYIMSVLIEKGIIPKPKLVKKTEVGGK